MRSEQHLRTFKQVLENYPASMPLAKFLPGYFRQNKQMGSSDRRTCSRLLYTYFRLGLAFPEKNPEERLFLAEFLCQSAESSLLAHFRPDLNERITQSISEKTDFLKQSDPDFDLEQVFPFCDHLSAGIDQRAFLQSLFIQPDLFIRILPGKESMLKARLDLEGIAFMEESAQTLRLPNGTKLDQIFPNQDAFEVQDLSSQQTGAYFQPQKYDNWWDACAASGGKSLLLFHEQPEIKLVVSDIRESVLQNLEERFLRAGIRKYQKKILDLTEDPEIVLHDYEFDGIILDAPCTGSGTWGRSPEMISQFRESNILVFQRLQQAIVKNVVKYLKPGKPLIYITCSVFREENEEVVEFICREFGFTVEKVGLLKGYEKRADTMFVARVIKSDGLSC